MRAAACWPLGPGKGLARSAPSSRRLSGQSRVSVLGGELAVQVMRSGCIRVSASGGPVVGPKLHESCAPRRAHSSCASLTLRRTVAARRVARRSSRLPALRGRARTPKRLDITSSAGTSPPRLLASRAMPSRCDGGPWPLVTDQSRLVTPRVSQVAGPSAASVTSFHAFHVARRCAYTASTTGKP